MNLRLHNALLTIYYHVRDFNSTHPASFCSSETPEEVMDFVRIHAYDALHSEENE
ncbi:MAG: hypothetical protein ACOCQD_03870 [archaeon]